MADRLIASVTHPAPEGAGVPASAGVAVATAGGVDAVALLREADIAMHVAAARGEGQIELADLSGSGEAGARARRIAAIRRGLRRQEFRVYYQPVVAIGVGTGADIGVEALVRWAPDDGPVIGPDRFIREAEESGLIVPLGEWVLRESCRQMVEWIGQGRAPSSVSVNLSACQLAEPGLLQRVGAALKETGLTPARLCLEVTESVLIDDESGSVDTLMALRALGVRIAIDDFGTGYSSLGYLRRFPVDVVKLDRSFVTDVSADPEAAAMVAAVVNMASALGLTVTAEGIETDEQLVTLIALGCNRGQGYRWSAPLPAAELGAILADPPRGDAGVVTLDVSADVQDAVDELRTATGRDISFTAPDGPAHATAHPYVLRTALGHLVINAVAESGEDDTIAVSVAAFEDRVEVSVADAGPGMTPEEVERCYEQFWRSDRSRAGRGGAGMGLWMVRAMVEELGGRVACRSTPGQGTVSTFSLPR